MRGSKEKVFEKCLCVCYNTQKPTTLAALRSERGRAGGIGRSEKPWKISR